MQELVEGIIEWFNKKIRLHVGGLDIKKVYVMNKSLLQTWSACGDKRNQGMSSR